MTTWIVGDIHGCADELEALVALLRPAPGDTLVGVGDLFHRGPDPYGVLALLRAHGARFVLGNHERTVLARCGLAPRTTSALDRPPFRQEFPDLDDLDLRGDGALDCRVEPHQRADVLRFLQRHSGYALRSRDLPGAGPTPDGRAFTVVHAGLLPRTPLDDQPIEALTSLRRLHERGNPWWYERYDGPDLVLFGHTQSPLPRRWHSAGRLVALGLDTGCVFGGRLTAYSPELDEFVAVTARAAYARSA